MDTSILLIQTNRKAMDIVFKWAEAYDEKDISDVAREWADSEVDVVAFPETKGELMAMLELAFDAGQIYRIALSGV